MVNIKTWFLKQYLSTIKFGHLIILTLLGLWPCYIDHNTNSYKSTWYLRFYSLTILASIIALLINTSMILNEDVTKAHPSSSGNTVAYMLTFFTVLAIVIIYLVQIIKVEEINELIQNGKELFSEICDPSTIVIHDWSYFLKNFTNHILVNGTLMSIMTASRVSYLSPKAAADFSLIFFYSIPNIILCVLMSVFYCGLSVLNHYFGILNDELAEIANTDIFDVFIVKKYPNYQRMKKFCCLSDRIDKISSLHRKLCKLTTDFCDVFALQYITSNSFTVALWIFKLFVDFLFIKRYIMAQKYDRVSDLVWVASLNIATSIIDLSSTAGVCSKIKAKYRETVNLTHKMCHCPNIDSRFMKSIEVLSIQLTQNKLKLSPYGLYEIDYALIFSIVSATYSYLILLIQFELAGSNSRKVV